LSARVLQGANKRICYSIQTRQDCLSSWHSSKASLLHNEHSRFNSAFLGRGPIAHFLPLSHGAHQGPSVIVAGVSVARPVLYVIREGRRRSNGVHEVFLDALFVFESALRVVGEGPHVRQDSRAVYDRGPRWRHQETQVPGEARGVTTAGVSVEDEGPLVLPRGTERRPHVHSVGPAVRRVVA
jgi:hypothetical protein